MPNPKDIYPGCDDLDSLPPLMKENYLCETELVNQMLPKAARVLQVGSMDGERISHLLRARPDLKLTGLEIEVALVKLARRKMLEEGLQAEFIHGDITKPPVLPVFDYVICLNNTFGYIPDQQKALAGMQGLGRQIVMSVYGEKFTNRLAHEYFNTLGLEVDHHENDIFVMKDFTTIRRYSRQEVTTWGGEITETPVGYFCVLQSSPRNSGDVLPAIARRAKAEGIQGPADLATNMDDYLYGGKN